MTDKDLIRRGDAGDIALEADLGWHDGISGDWHPFSAKDVCNHIATAIRALPAQVQPAPVAVTVKRLEWREVTNRKDRAMLWACPDAQVTYEITRHIDAHFSVTRFFRGDKAATSLGAYQTIEAAQAAAQADHSARILSAVNLRPVAEVQAEAVAGAYAAAAEKCTYIIKNYEVMNKDGQTYAPMRTQNAARGMVKLAREDILALTPADAQAALDRIRAEAREKALREVLSLQKYVVDPLAEDDKQKAGWVSVSAIIAMIEETTHEPQRV